MIDNGQDRPEEGTGKEERDGRAGCPHKRSDVAGALLRATAKRRVGEAAMASSLVGHDALSIAPSLAPSPDRLSDPSWPLSIMSTGPRHPGELYNEDVGHAPGLSGARPGAGEAKGSAVAAEGGREVEGADVDVFGERNRNRPVRACSPGDVQDAFVPDHPP